MSWLKYLGYGWVILLAAIVVNVLSSQLGASTWYSYIRSIFSVGFHEATLSLPVLNIVFLYVIYPSIFGAVVKLAVDRSRRANL